MSTIQEFRGKDIAPELIKDAAVLFSENYGIWSEEAARNMQLNIVAGSRIKISTKVLREKILSGGIDNIYIRAMETSLTTKVPILVGNVFATAYETPSGHKVVWITQLCVSSAHRNRGVAKSLLQSLLLSRQDHSFGILSSHPFAIQAVLSVCGTASSSIDFEFIKENAEAIMASCPVGYVKNAKLRGSLWGPGDDGTVCCANTEFWVNHTEPLEALRIWRESGVVWPFGNLPSGCEFLMITKPSTLV